MSPGGSSNRYRQAEALFQHAVELPAERRAAFLEHACTSDVGLRAEVVSLLEHYAAAGDAFLDRPLHEFASFAETWSTPDRIGAYRVVRQIDQGGMGVVFEARQENPPRSVAIKAIRPGIASAESLRRFELEATILGQLQHPGIAHIYEAGIADVVMAGKPPARQPFFAMELVQGEPLLEHVRSHGLALKQRLQLFTRICDAVEYAHRKGVIHRDLKPANILVTAGREPKVLDFGVARMTRADVRLATMHTGAAQVLGTLAYMSPEQIAGPSDLLDTRSDVYSLGVILYELIADRPPYDLADQPLAAAVRVVSEQSPTPLAQLNRVWRGDLDTIVRKALEKDPERRYPSAHALAADVQHYLNREPIAARPASATYQFRKFAQRNRALVGGVAATLLALLLGVAGTTYGLLEMTRQRNDAQLQSRITAAVNDFLNEDLLAPANPYNDPDRDIRLREVLDRAGARIEGRFAHAPLVEAAIRETLGTTYRNLGEYDVAETHLRRALDLVQAGRGENDRRAIQIMLDLGDTFRLAARYDEAHEFWQAAAARAIEQWGPDDPTTLEARNDLGILAKRRGQPEAAAETLHDVLARRRRVLGNDHGATLVSMNTLGVTLEQLGRFDEAESLFRECVDRSRRVLGSEHPDTLTAISNLGLFYSRLDRYSEAEPLCLETLELRRRVLGEEHPETLIAMNNLGYLYCLEKRFDECEPLFVRVHAVRQRRFGPENPDTILSTHNLGWLYMQMQRWDDAENYFTEELEITRRTAPGSLDLALAMHAVGALYAKLGRYAEAEPLLREALAASRATMPDGDWRIGGALSAYGTCLRGLARFEDAEPLLLEGYQRQHAALGPEHHQTGRAVQALVDLYTDWGRPEDAADWQARLP